MTTSILAMVDPARSRVESRTGDSHVVLMDTDPPEGDASAARPKEVLLAALAGCTSMDVASILRKKRQSATGYRVGVSGESAEEHPRVFTTIRVEHRVEVLVEAEALRRSIELSATRYCPVNAMLSASATVEHWYRLNDPELAGAAVLVAVTGPGGSRVL